MNSPLAITTRPEYQVSVDLTPSWWLRGAPVTWGAAVAIVLDDVDFAIEVKVTTDALWVTVVLTAESDALRVIERARTRVLVKLEDVGPGALPVA